MNLSVFPNLISASLDACAQTAADIVNTQPINYFHAIVNNLSSADVDAILISLDGNGVLGGTVDVSGQTPLAPPSPAGQISYANLVGKGWTVTTDPWQFTFDDGGGGFWDLVVNTAGNVGTTAGVAPATADVILADGFGGFWKVAVDVTGLRYTIADPGPATAAPVLFDGEGGFWQLVVDALGNLGATLVYHYPVYWEPYTEIVTWTDTNGVQTGNLVDFTATVDLATLSDVTANGLAITELIFDGTQLPALTTITCPNNAALTNLQVPNCAALTTLDCNTCDITGTLDVSGLALLTTLDCSINANLTAVTLTGCISANQIQCSYSNITGTLNASNLGNLNALLCVGNPNLTQIVFTNCSLLTIISCSSCSINALTDIDDCTSLSELYCDTNQIVSIDVSFSLSMSVLDCYSQYIGAVAVLTNLNIGASANYIEVLAQDNALPNTPNGVNECLVLLETNCLGNVGTVDVDTVGTNSAPTGAGAIAALNLAAAGWTVTTN